MMEAPEVDVPDPEDIKDHYQRTVAILIVVGTLAGAVVGFLQTQAGRKGDEAAVTAQRLATQAMGQLLRSQQIAQVDFETYALADQEQRRSASARQGFIFQAGEFERVQELAQERWDQLAEQTRTLTKINQDSPEGPILDPGFPGQFFAKAVREAVRLRALQDAANETDGAWSGKESTYTAILTVFAVALYLLGLSLTVQVGVRRMFAGLGLSLIMIGAVWAVALALSAPVEASPEAAEAFADGHVKLQAAGSPEQYQSAVEDFDRAIELRPTFAEAYEERAEAHFNAGAPAGQGLLSVTRPESLDASTEDYETALELGLENPTTVGNLGFHRFLQGLRDGDGNLLEEGLEFDERAQAMDPNNPVFAFNKGVTLLALDRVEEARAAYEEGIRMTIFSDPASETLREDPGTEEFYVAGALTDLEILARARPEMAEQVKGLKELVVGSDTLNRVGVGETALEVPADTIDIEVFPSELQWTAFLPGYDPDTDVVSQQWYYEGPEKLGWAALPSVSGIYAPRVEDDEGFFQLQSYLASTFPPSCLSAGTFRVELYANGKLVGQAQIDEELPELTAYVPSDLNAALCRPSDWVRSEDVIDGWLDGYVSPENDRGVFVLRYSPPRTDNTFDLLDGSIDIFANLFPEKPVLDEGEGTDTDFFLGLDNPRKRWYNYEGGYVRAGAGEADDGSVIVAFVFGPTDLFDETGDLALRVFDSFIEYEPVTP